MLNVSATQELKRQVDELQSQVAQLNSEREALFAQVAALVEVGNKREAQLSKLEATLAERVAQK